MIPPSYRRASVYCVLPRDRATGDVAFALDAGGSADNVVRLRLTAPEAERLGLWLAEQGQAGVLLNLGDRSRRLGRQVRFTSILALGLSLTVLVVWGLFLFGLAEVCTR